MITFKRVLSILPLLVTMLLLVSCKEKSKKITLSPQKRPLVTPQKRRPTPKIAQKKKFPPKLRSKAKPKTPQKISMLKYLNKPPKGFVDLRKFIPTLAFHIGYHTPKNFTGAPLPGYGAPGAWMVKRAALALKKVQQDLAKKGLGLLVYDAYRPVRASLGMVAWAKRTRKLYLFRKGYIARYSGHNRGHTIDLTIISLKTKKPLDMGTPWDTLTPQSHTRNAKGRALKNRYLLKRAMERRGFRYYHREWWHFHYPMRGLRRRDVPYGCYEAPEFRWKPPKGWDKPGFQMPLQWHPKPCSL